MQDYKKCGECEYCIVHKGQPRPITFIRFCNKKLIATHIKDEACELFKEGEEK